MIGCRSLVVTRTYTQAWRNTQILQYQQLSKQQKYDFFPCVSCESKMDYTKRKQRIEITNSRRQDATVKQIWRKVCTQPSYEGGKEELQRSGQQEMHHSTSQVTYEDDDADPKVETKPVDAPECSSFVGSSISDMHVDGKLNPSIKHSVTMEIGASLIRFVRGKEGCTRDEIEEEFGVKIVFLNSKEEESIIIESNSAESIAKASEKIQSIIDQAINSRELDYSHFISLPLAIHPGLVEKLINFQNVILGADASGKNENVNIDQNSVETPVVSVELKPEHADAPVKVNVNDIPLASYLPKESKAPASQTRSPIELGIEKSIFIKPKTFHLTVLMLKLWNKDRVKAASEVLQSVSSRVVDALDGRPVSIRLKGLDSMKGSLSKTRVLYAPVEEVGGESRLLRACQVITDAFVEAGLVIEKDVQHKLKLHATVMNARHRKRRKGTRKLDSFDARGIFDLYGSEEWGEYLIREAHLSQRFAFDESGYYHCCTSIPFPDDVQAN